MFYDSYIKTCEQFGISPTRLLADLKISKSSYGHWKSGGEPLNETKKKIADYLGITVDELISANIKTAPVIKTEADEMTELLQECRDNKDLRTLFSLSKKATPEQLKQYIGVIKALRGSDED